jgi:hypothetical protein
VRPLSYALAAVAVANLAWFGAKAATNTSVAPTIHVQWRPGVSDRERTALERELTLIPQLDEQQHVVAYELVDSSPENIERLVHHAAVLDTHEIDRDEYALSAAVPQGNTQRWLAHRALSPGAVSVLDWLLPASLGVCLVVVRYLAG